MENSLLYNICNKTNHGFYTSYFKHGFPKGLETIFKYLTTSLNVDSLKTIIDLNLTLGITNAFLFVKRFAQKVFICLIYIWEIFLSQEMLFFMKICFHIHISLLLITFLMTLPLMTKLFLLITNDHHDSYHLSNSHVPPIIHHAPYQHQETSQISLVPTKKSNQLTKPPRYFQDFKCNSTRKSSTIVFYIYYVLSYDRLYDSHFPYVFAISNFIESSTYKKAR